jgi:hypothetical protein
MGSHSRQDPFELSNLLHAGVLALTLSGLDQNHSHAVFSGAWTTFNHETARSHHPFCCPQDIALLKSLSFLIKHEFARITSNFLPLHRLILLRLYLIPFDLPGVQGRLMKRQEQILVQYRRFLKEILPRIIRDGDYWSGADMLPPNPSLLLPRSLVGTRIDPSMFVVGSKLFAGLENYGRDIQRAALPGT